MTKSEIFAKGLGTIVGVMVPCLIGLALAGAEASEIVLFAFVGPSICYLGWKRGRVLGREELRLVVQPHVEKIQAIASQRKVQP